MRKRLISVIIVILLIVLMTPNNDVYAFNKWGKDPKPGTAPKYIEDAIAEGMKAVESRMPYLYGGGRDESTYSQSGPMDCSAFMHYIFNKGSGILLVNNNPNHAGAGPDGLPAVTTLSLLSNMDVIHGVSKEELQRGDLIFFTGHVGIYLGDGIFLNSAGDRNRSHPGASLADLNNKAWSSKYTGQVIRIKEGGKGVYLKEGATIDASMGEVSEHITDGSKRPKGLTFFKQRTIKTKNTGVVDGQDKMTMDTRNIFNDISKKAYLFFIKVGVILSLILIGYTSIVVILYFTINNRTSITTKGTIGIFEKLTGISPVYSKENTKKILGSWVVSMVIMSIFLIGLYVDLMAIVYTLIDKVWII